jgi:hypothetical protein
MLSRMDLLLQAALLCPPKRPFPILSSNGGPSAFHQLPTAYEQLNMKIENEMVEVANSESDETKSDEQSSLSDNSNVDDQKVRFCFTFTIVHILLFLFHTLLFYVRF